MRGRQDRRSIFRSRAISRRAFLRAGIGVGATVLAGSGAVFYGAEVEPNELEVVRVKVPVRRLPAAFAGLVIAQISDLHFGPYVGIEVGRAVADTVRSLNPDLVVVTGDHASRLTHNEAAIISEVLSLLVAPLGVYAIFGNHEYWTDPTVVSGAIRRAGTMLLRNSNTAIRRGGEVLYLAGLDDAWNKHDDLSASLAGVPEGGCTIFLAHEPDVADQASRDPRVALQISGHTHGGQVRLPGLGPIRLPRLGKKYSQGLYDVAGMQLYVNRGIGMVFPPVRINCRPEVSLLQLRPL